MSVLYQQKPNIHFRQLDDEFFLADSEMNSMFNLNSLGTVIWRALENPMTTDDVITLLSEAFPDTDASKIRADVLSLFDNMKKAGIIIEIVDREGQ